MPPDRRDRLTAVLHDLHDLSFLASGEPAPSPPADPGRQRLLRWQDEARHALIRGEEPAVLPQLRTEAYRLASCTWEDPWAYGMVAWTEEATAENERLHRRVDELGDAWLPAWSAWRTAWWIRRTAGAQAPEERARHDLIMAMLHLRTLRIEQGVERLRDSMPGLRGAWRSAGERVWQAVAVHDEL